MRNKLLHTYHVALSGIFCSEINMANMINIAVRLAHLNIGSNSKTVIQIGNSKERLYFFG